MTRRSFTASLARHFPIFPFPKRQVFPANHTPIPARLLFHHRHFLLFRHVTLARVGKRAL